MPSMRIPFTDPLPVVRIVPASATTLTGAVSAVAKFLSTLDHKTVLLTGAGISVAVCTLEACSYAVATCRA
jgi:NAD-dependent deacetylase sirtuin 4